MTPASTLPLNATPPRATWREWLGLAVIALPCLVYAMDLTVLNLAVPALSADLKPSSTQLLWIVDIYGFMAAGFLMTMGSLGDRVGRRRLLMWGAAAFGLASVAAALSQTTAALIGARALLGVAGATLAPSTLSLIRHMFHDPGQRTVAIGVWISSYSLGAAIGPVMGGLLLANFHWTAVFWLALPVMALLLLLGPRLLPEYRDPEAPPVDWTSTGLSLAAVLSGVWGVKQLAESGWAGPPLLAVAVGIGFAGLFVRRQLGLSVPMVNLRWFREPAFSAALLAYAIAAFTAFGAFIFIGQALQLVFGMSPLRAGLWTVPSAAAFVLGSMATPWLSSVFSSGRVVTAGLLCAALGYGLLMQVGPQSAPVWMVGAVVVYSLGLAPVFTLATDLMVGSVPPQQAGVAAALSETASELGGALGIALLGSLGTAVYGWHLHRALPEGLSHEQAATVRSTLAAALETSAPLPMPLGDAVVAAARHAFMHSLQAAALAALLLTLATALWVGRRLRASAAQH